MIARNPGRGDRATAGTASLGLAALAAGALVYVVARDPGSSWLPGGLGLDPAGHAGWLPAASHALGFTLLGAAVAGLSRRSLALSAAFWTVVGWAFEALQHPGVAAALLPLHELQGGSAVASSARMLLARHAHLGTFDPLDLAATALGALLALLAGRRLLDGRPRASDAGRRASGAGRRASVARGSG